MNITHIENLKKYIETLITTIKKLNLPSINTNDTVFVNPLFVPSHQPDN
jgi:hypothetical protein